jgi:hypothetical protein
MVAQQLDQAIRPMLTRLNDIEEACEHHERIVNCAGVGMKLCEQRSGLFARQSESHGEAAVPESRVVRADIANNGQVMQEGAGAVTILPEIAVIAAWGVLTFAVAIRIFRWE